MDIALQVVTESRRPFPAASPIGRGASLEHIWFYAVRWWTICKGYALEERRKQSDSTLFTDFEDLAKRFLVMDSKAGLTESTPTDLDRFLEDERDLDK